MRKRDRNGKRKLARHSKRVVFTALAFGFIFALIIAELLVRAILPHPAHFRGHPANVPGLVTQHDVRGYTWTPGFEGRMTSVDFNNYYEISEQGLRDEIVENDGSDRILAIGDSFTGGEGTEADETWPKQLEYQLNQNKESESRTRVINAGVTGYGARQMRQMAEELVPIFEPRHVIVGIYTNGYDRVENPFTLVGVHLVRKEYAEEMSVMDDGYIFWHQTGFKMPLAVSFETWTQNNWHFAAYVLKVVHRIRRNISRQSALPRPPASIRLQPVFEELSLMDQFLESRGIEFTVLAICGQGGDGTFISDNKLLAAALKEFGDENGIHVFDPTATLEQEANGQAIFRFENDGHWTPAAHRLVGRELAKSIQDMR